MEKITIPNVGTWKSDDLKTFFKFLSELNACNHAPLSYEDQMKIKVASMGAIDDIFRKIDYTESRCCIPPDFRNFDSDDQDQFYRNMWSHREQK